jgi:DNA-binding LacI/PurR family transcriptional regulator
MPPTSCETQLRRSDIVLNGVAPPAGSVLTVPGDLSVVGFDDSILATTAPPLTTVRQPFAQMGGVAYRILSDRIEGREPSSLLVELATTLIVRGSTAPRR